jgi:hypothetical protein
MSLSVFLDTGPLGLVTNPKPSPVAVACIKWAFDLDAAGHRLVVPAIADYELRRELERAGKAVGIASLDAFNSVLPDRYLPLSDTALRIGAKLWARARNAGSSTADPKELDADVLIAAQVLDMNLKDGKFVVATTNVGHLSQFVPAKLWSDIQP